MRNLLAAVLGVCCIAFFSCQKEVNSDILGGTPNPGNGTKLVRIGTRFGADSLTTNLSYNNVNRLTAINYEGTVTGIPTTMELRIVRNSSNIIVSTISKSNIYTIIGIDSVVSNCVYDAANSRYKYEVGYYQEFGLPRRDSAVFSYASNGQLVSATGYHDDGSGYQLDSKDSVFYNGNNIAVTKSYSYNGTDFELDQEIQYELYDNKVNPLQFTADAPLLGMSTHYSANNVTKRTMIDYASGDSGTGIFTYTYNNSNRPLKATSTDGTNTSVSTYYYQ